MNAYKDGLRSKKRVLLRDESYAFENRKQKWMAKANPSDDMGEFLVNQIVCQVSRSSTRSALCGTDRPADRDFRGHSDRIG